MVKNNYDNWTKEELIKEVKALKKQKTYGLVWEEDKTKEDFDYYINWEGEKNKESFGEEEGKFPVLKEVKDKSIDNGDPKYNLMIEGDNYHSLAVLNFTHNKAIDVIYIDPPYNTGRKNEWKYNDKWVDNEDAYKHSKWLSFMSKRLKLAKNLLRDSGVIFISIDDNEVAQLRILCDEIFGEENRLDRGMIVWNNAGSTKGFKNIVKNHEYILAYARNINRVNNYFGKNFPEECGSVEHYCFNAPSYKNPICKVTFKKGTPIKGANNITFEKEVGDKVKLKIVSGKMIFKGGKLSNDVVLEGAFPYRFQIEEYYSNLEKGLPTFDRKGQKWEEIFFNSNGLPRYFKNKNTVIFDSILKDIPNYGATQLEEIFGKKVFDFPKPKELVLELLKYFSSRDAIILDFFAGSGTTGHAVMEMNSISKGKRKFILCTNDEDNNGNGLKIATDICYPRIKKIIGGYKDNKGKDVEGSKDNFKYFKTDFVDSAPTDQNKKKIVDKSTEMLCIKENAFKLVKEKSGYKIFKNTDIHLGIIFDEDEIDNFIKDAKEIKGKFNVYVFSLDDSVPEREFRSMKGKVKLCPIPEAILHVYRRIFK